MKVNGVEYLYRVKWDDERFITKPSEYGLPGNYAKIKITEYCRDLAELKALIKLNGENKNYLIESTFNNEFRLLRIAA